MLHLLVEGNKELNDRKFQLPKKLKEHLKETLANYKGSHEVAGYERLNNILQMDYITYVEMKRIKNFFDNYKGTDKSAEYILNGGGEMKFWVNDTLYQATQAIKDFKTAKKNAGFSNAFIKPHEKDRQTKPSKPSMIKARKNNVTKNVADNQYFTYESRIVKLTETQLREIKEELSKTDI